MKRKGLFVAGTIFFLACIAILPVVQSNLYAQQQKAAATALAQIIEGAKKEGKLTVYSSINYDEAIEINAPFKKKYPFLEIENVYLAAGDVVTRTMSEFMAGMNKADAIGTGGGTFEALVKGGVLQPVDWAALGIAKAAIATPIQVTTATITYPIGYNTKLVPASEVPKAWDDFMDPKWKGKIMVWASPMAFTELIPTLGEEHVTKLVKGIMANKPMVIRTSGEAISTLIAGGAALVPNVNYREKKRVILKGAPIGYKWLDPIPMSRYDYAVAKKAPHPNAAKLYISWLATPEGLAVYERVFNRGNIFVPESGLAKETKGMRFSTLPPERYSERAEYDKKLSKIITP